MGGSYACIYVSYEEANAYLPQTSELLVPYEFYINTTNSIFFEKYKITPIDAKIVSYFLKKIV